MTRRQQQQPTWSFFPHSPTESIPLTDPSSVVLIFLLSFLKGLLNKKAKDRLDWPHLLSHPFVRETNEEIESRRQQIRSARMTLSECQAWKGENGAVAGAAAALQTQSIQKTNEAVRRDQGDHARSEGDHGRARAGNGCGEGGEAPAGEEGKKGKENRVGHNGSKISRGELEGNGEEWVGPQGGPTPGDRAVDGAIQRILSSGGSLEMSEVSPEILAQIFSAFEAALGRALQLWETSKDSEEKTSNLNKVLTLSRVWTAVLSAKGGPKTKSAQGNVGKSLFSSPTSPCVARMAHLAEITTAGKVQVRLTSHAKTSSPLGPQTVFD